MTTNHNKDRHWVKDARKALVWSQSQMANALGTTDRAVRRWEKGEHGIPGSVKIAVQSFLDKEGLIVDVDDECRCGTEVDNE